MRTTRLRATLREVEPKVERVIEVPAAITLDDLHEVLQVALGWTNSHLHQFRTEETTYAVAADGWTTRCSSLIWSGMRVRLEDGREVEGWLEAWRKDPDGWHGWSRHSPGRLRYASGGSTPSASTASRRAYGPTGRRTGQSGEAGRAPGTNPGGPTSLIPDYAHS